MLRALLVLAGWLCVSCLAAAALPETPQFRRFGFDQGLPKSVNHIALDHQGYIWVATSDGLARYDGVGFQLWRHEIGATDTLPDNTIDTIFVDARNRVWAASAVALSVIGANRRQVHTLRLPAVSARCTRNVTAMTGAADGGMWIATSGGDLCLRDRHGHVQRHAPPAGEDVSIMTLLVDARGRLLLGTSKGLLHFERGAFRAVAQEVFGGTSISMLTTDPDGALWIGSEKGLHQLHPDDRATQAPWPLPASATHASVLRDRQGGRWIGTMHGLYRDNGHSFSLVRNQAATGLLDQESGILYMLQDLEGGLWLVTYSQGLVYLPPDWNRFATIDSAGGRLLEGLDLRDAAGDGAAGFWVATATNLYHLARGSGVLRNVASNSALDVQWIHSLRARADGSLWVGHSTGLALFDPVTHRARNC